MKTIFQLIFERANRMLTTEAFNEFMIFAYGALTCALDENHPKNIVRNTLIKRLDELEKDKNNLYISIKNNL
jgi:hypothetical protein